ncbi:MAG TPA: HD domain-containing protein [Steroidobacteraceae bacterium]|jgi:phosphonate degradation associated HDIG domain protein
MTLVEEISELFKGRGGTAYFGESVSMSEHSLQAAYFAQAEGAPPALIIAALLHDVGHLVDDVPNDIHEWTTDARHEEVGGRWLARRFPASVFEPVRLHVPAKRYLCATDGAYFAKLSPASVLTLKLQGGPMSPDETTHFETEPYYREAVRVRRWDDAGKVAGLITPAVLDYRTLIEAVRSQG